MIKEINFYNPHRSKDAKETYRIAILEYSFGVKDAH